MFAKNLYLFSKVVLLEKMKCFILSLSMLSSYKFFLIIDFLFNFHTISLRTKYGYESNQ